MNEYDGDEYTNGGQVPESSRTLNFENRSAFAHCVGCEIERILSGR